MGDISARGFADGDRVVWIAGPAYGADYGPGVLQGFHMHERILLAHVRFDDPGLDDEEIPLDQLRRES